MSRSIPLDDWSAPTPITLPDDTQTLTKDNGFQPAVPESERPQTHALDRVATGIGLDAVYQIIYSEIHWWVQVSST
jgi:hypothetical protein